MKTREFFLALAVAAAAIATSCVKEQIEDPQDKPEVEITGQVFEANHEVLTKSTLVDLTPTWVEGDQIFVSGSDEDATCTFVEGLKDLRHTLPAVQREDACAVLHRAQQRL